MCSSMRFGSNGEGTAVETGEILAYVSDIGVAWRAFAWRGVPIEEFTAGTTDPTFTRFIRVAIVKSHGAEVTRDLCDRRAVCGCEGSGVRG